MGDDWTVATADKIARHKPKNNPPEEQGPREREDPYNALGGTGE